MKAEIEEEEKKILVVGFPIASRDQEAKLPGLVASMMREGVLPRKNLSIDWMKEEANGKKSLILLNAGTSQNRDFILMNLKKDKDYIVKKSFPARYMQAQRKLNEMGHALRKMHDEKVNTELW